MLALRRFAAFSFCLSIHSLGMDLANTMKLALVACNSDIGIELMYHEHA
jgi:hypothetical protein